MYPIAKHTNRSLRIPVLAGVTLLFAMAFASPRAGNSSHPASQRATDAQLKQHWYQFGRASWYGHALQGLETASGEPYDMNGMTCAHRFLPLGALVRVTNLRNHRSIVVRVNDRGPIPENRVVDLSYAAAHKLGFSHRGLAPVRIDVVSMKPSRAEVASLAYPPRP